MRSRLAVAALLLVPALPLSAAGGHEIGVGATTAENEGGETGRCVAALAGAALAGAALEIEPDPEPPTGDACRLTGAVRVTGGAVVDLNRPFFATCEFAAAFARFEREVLQPAAERHLGRRVARLEHSGAYRCSYVEGGGGRRSQHATANALDLHAFVLDDGAAVSVLEHWHAPGPAGAFLREVAQRACGVFSAVLGPSYNRAHRDHLHLDLGPHDICSEAEAVPRAEVPASDGGGARND